MKVPGVQRVDVSLERATTEIQLNPDNTVTLEELRKIIKANGFNAGDATVTAQGTVVEHQGKPAFALSGTTVVWQLARDPSQPGATDDVVRRLPRGATIEVTGVVPRPAGEATVDVLRVHKSVAR